MSSNYLKNGTDRGININKDEELKETKTKSIRNI